jgi:hypothetical protein
MRPKGDAAVLARIEHVPVPAGAAVFWDVRIPHANSLRQEAAAAREVVYTGLLPATLMNHRCASHCSVLTAGFY